MIFQKLIIMISKFSFMFNNKKERKNKRLFFFILLASVCISKDQTFTLTLLPDNECAR